MVKHFFDYLARDIASQRFGGVYCFGDQQGVDIIACQNVIGILTGDIRPGGDGRRGHEIFGLPPGVDFTV